jgi:hypothetical protein
MGLVNGWDEGREMADESNDDGGLFIRPATTRSGKKANPRKGHIPVWLAFLASLATAGASAMASSATTSFIDRDIASRQQSLKAFEGRRSNLNRFTDKVIIDRINALDSAFDVLSSPAGWRDANEALAEARAAAQVFQETEGQFRFDIGDYDKAVYRPINNTLVLAITPSFDRLEGCLRLTRNARFSVGPAAAQAAMDGCLANAAGTPLKIEGEIKRLRTCVRSFAGNLKFPQQSIAENLTVNLQSGFWQRAMAVVKSRQPGNISDQVGLSRMVTSDKMKAFADALPAELENNCGLLKAKNYGAPMPAPPTQVIVPFVPPPTIIQAIPVPAPTH